MSEPERTGMPSGVLAEDRYAIERYFARKCGSEFVYDEELDVFRFAENGATRSSRGIEFQEGLAGAVITGRYVCKANPRS